MGNGGNGVQEGRQLGQGWRGGKALGVTGEGQAAKAKKTELESQPGADGEPDQRVWISSC